MKINALIMFLLIVGIASAATLHITACTVLAAGNTYILDNDITINTTGNCMNVNGANIILDGQGYTLSNMAGGSGYYGVVENSFAGFELRNLRIINFTYGVGVSGVGQTIKNVTTINCSSDGIYVISASTGLYINNVSIISNNTNYGLRFGSAGDVNGAVIANISISMLNGQGTAILFNRTNATISNLIANATIYQDGANTLISYTNITGLTDLGLINCYPNRTSELNITDLSSSGAIIVRSYDASTSARINKVNYTIYGTGTTYFYDRFWVVLDSRIYNASTSMAKVEENIGYYASWLDLAQSYLSGTQTQILMVPKNATDVSLINFHVQDSMNNPLSNATCSIFKSYNGNWWLVSAKKSESSGVVAHYMQTSFQYKIICSAAGYSTLTTYVTPTSADYSIFLTTTTGGIGYPTDVEGVRTTFNSTGPFQWNETQTLTFTIYNTSVNSSLDFFAWVIKNGTTTLNTQNDSTHPSGGSLTYTFMPGNNSNITVRIIFLRTSRSVVDYTFSIPTYLAYPNNPASLQAALVSMGSLGSFTVVIITLIVGAAVGGWVSGISAGAGIAAFLGILTLGFMTVNAILGGLVLLASFMVAAGYFMLRGGGE